MLALIGRFTLTLSNFCEFLFYFRKGFTLITISTLFVTGNNFFYFNGLTPITHEAGINI